ncbi:PQQ-binding-like beta-propeller repeat protein [Tsukamurella sp. 8F]|uniref:Rv3212 family protein n=1 Tax=unclassified Tsukamurella TaxID=2633480 RepID=UPI0023B9FC2B|nr:MULTISPECIES: PQQ-binding-like beta-propeller repeat protein [unclassified Tsukamurella]MDF0528919.1 PQQ-binding-like beta-propeller repeat protein [Tsukamurella sp. 8J]MDF0586754.1 PQQ-binding-like beta-propeller repeat protein [Tsukamurella sp. 8F]
MVRPERRTPADLVIAALIVVAVVVAGLAVWNFSSARRTTNVIAKATEPVPDPLTSLPAELHPTWSARSDQPVQVVEGMVATADGRTVAGIGSSSGKQLWRYTRDRDACGLITNTATILAFYPDARGCGEVTALDPATGERRYARSSREDRHVRLTTDGSYVVAQSPSRVDVLRSDLVLTVEYGTPDVPVQPGAQPRSGCTQLSALPTDSQIAILERCPTEPNPRLTVITAAPKDAATPQVTSSVIAPALGGDDGVRIIGATSTSVAVYVPPQAGRPARLEVLGTNGTEISGQDIATPPGGAPDVPVMRDGTFVGFYTGRDTLILDAYSFEVHLIIPGALGPGVMIGNEIVVPGPSTLTAYDPTGRILRAVDVERPGYTSGPVLLNLAGQTVVARWGDKVQAYQA